MKLLIALALLTVTHFATGQGFPTQPLRIVVPYPAGGGSDILARTFGKALTESLKLQIVIDNRPGAGGNIGAEFVSRSTPDGYTMVLTDTAIAISPTLYTKLGYDVVKDLTPISLLHASPHVLTVHPSVSAHDVKSLIALARANPGKLNFGSSGAGSSLHLSVVTLMQSTGINMTHIPFKGTAPAAVALVGGQVDLLVSGILPVMTQIKAGKLRALAVTALDRSVALPDVPTIAEAVPLPGFETILWGAIFVPAKTPRPIVQKLNAEVVKAIQRRDIRDFLVSQGANPASSTPEEFEKRLISDISMWGKLVKASGARID